MQPKIKLVRSDSKGRITLGRLAEGVSSYLETETEDHKLILEPRVEIAAREKWLFDDKVALKKIDKGLEDAATGRLAKKGHFSQFADDDIE